jgi:hypothetical protein
LELSHGVHPARTKIYLGLEVDFVVPETAARLLLIEAKATFA